jgi:septal ring factor EnvC (AmiA/AmiB activator)
LTVHRLIVAVLAASALATAAVPPDGPEASARRLAIVQQELVKLQTELAALRARERGVLGDVARLDVAIALDATRLEEATLKLRQSEGGLESAERSLARLEAAQSRRAPYLAARVREMYKQGTPGLLARALAPVAGSATLDGLRYAAVLSRRDAAQLAAWRRDAEAVRSQRTDLAQAVSRLESERLDASRSKETLEAGRAERARLLTRIRDDREQHAQAIGELDAAAKDLSRLVEGVGAHAAAPALDIRKFRGLLEWPAAGAVTEPFGKVIHPRFKTEVPHPGLDIDAVEGAPFRAVFEGRVAYAAPLHGYGLTVVLDHGNGLVSVYAHAGVVLVEAGQSVAGGQELGKVGDSGSLRGAYLYFELRAAGKPVDPAGWLRAR